MEKRRALIKPRVFSMADSRPPAFPLWGIGMVRLERTILSGKSFTRPARMARQRFTKR